MLVLEGPLEAPQRWGDFDYPAYLANQGIYSALSFPRVQSLDEGRGNPLVGEIHKLRRTLARHLDDILPQRQAALAQALLLGKRGDLAIQTRDDFRDTGTSHLLAVSGLHVGVVLFLSIGASAFLLGRRAQLYLLLPLVMVWLYALLTGMAPPVQRTAVMGAVYLSALALGRPRSVLPALVLAAAMMAGVQPRMLRDVAFQLSFASVAGIALVIPWLEPLEQRLVPAGWPLGGWRARFVRALSAPLLIGVAATIATLPLIAFYFHRVPTLGVVATMVALPAMPVILVTSALAAVADLILPELGQVLGWVAWVPLSYLLSLVHLIARVPGSTVSPPALGGILVLAYYMVLVLLLVMPGGLGSIARLPPRLRQAFQAGVVRVGIPGGASAALLLGLVALVAALLWFRVVTGPDGRLHVTFLDIGQGDAIFIETPSGRRILVDGGPLPMGAAIAIGDRMNFWDRRLDLLVLTHAEEDHFRGLTEVVRRYDVDVVLEGGVASTSSLYQEWDRAVEAAGILRVQALRGQRVDLGEMVRLEVLHPPSTRREGTASDQNNNGVVLRLSYGEVSFLLTADIQMEGEWSLLQEYDSLQSTVLKVAHHGSRTSTLPEFLSAVQPRLAVVSAGEDNPFGHSSSDVMEKLLLELDEDSIYVTAQDGDIEFITDGVSLSVRTRR